MPAVKRENAAAAAAADPNYRKLECRFNDNVLLKGLLDAVVHMGND